jgi:hypothetical protein
MTLFDFPKEIMGHKKPRITFLRPYQELFQEKIVCPGEEPGCPALHDQIV